MAFRFGIEDERLGVSPRSGAVCVRTDQPGTVIRVPLRTDRPEERVRRDYPDAEYTTRLHLETADRLEIEALAAAFGLRAREPEWVRFEN